MRTGLYEEKRRGNIYFRGRNTHNQRKEKKKKVQLKKLRFLGGFFVTFVVTFLWRVRIHQRECFYHNKFF
jgi:hypothetical protein